MAQDNREFATANALHVLEAINDGVYVTDCDRRILYWNQGAQRITGWTEGDVVGRSCHDDLLCHVDKDGRRLCGQEHCPLHRAIITGNAGTSPIIVFATAKDGKRVPLRVTVAPVMDATGRIIGGVETFRDLSADMHDIQRAREIQLLSMQVEPLLDPGISFRTHYVSRDIIGGDFAAVARLGEGRYGFMLADVSGHGLPAALYTMCLGTLWEAHVKLLPKPVQFAAAMSKGLADMVKESGPFATAVCGVVNLREQCILLAGAGGPSPYLFRSGRPPEMVSCPGIPLGLFEAQYEELRLAFGQDDALLLCSDGAVEVTLPDGSMLGEQGFLQVVQGLGYAAPSVGLEHIEESLLKLSDRVRFDDDLTLLEIRRGK